MNAVPSGIKYQPDTCLWNEVAYKKPDQMVQKSFFSLASSCQSPKNSIQMQAALFSRVVDGEVEVAARRCRAGSQADPAPGSSARSLLTL